MSATQTSSCTFLKMDPGSNGKYSTCAKFCETSCFGQCKPGANCPQDRNGTCKEVGLPDFSQGACCEKARLSNGVQLECDKPFSSEQLSLLTRPENDKRPKVEAECCCSAHTCARPSPSPPPRNDPPPPKPKAVPPQDDPKNVTVEAGVYADLQTKRALWLNTTPPKQSAIVAAPPPVAAMPPLRPSKSRKGNCLVYAPHGCRPGGDNPHAGQTFPTQAAKDEWAVIDVFKPRKQSKTPEDDLVTYGVQACLSDVKTQWHAWCNSHPNEKGKELHPIFTMFCVDDKRCFSDPDCVRNPDGCTNRPAKK